MTVVYITENIHGRAPALPYFFEQVLTYCDIIYKLKDIGG